MIRSLSQRGYDDLRADRAGFPAWLAVLHSNPFRSDAGGTERHVLDLTSALAFPRALIAYPDEAAIIVAEISSRDPGRPLFHRFPLGRRCEKIRGHSGLDRANQSHPGNRRRVPRIFSQLPSSVPRVCLEWPEAEEATDRIVECMGVGVVHIHHLLHWPVRIWRIFERRGIPFFFTAHDFYCVCRNESLTSSSKGSWDESAVRAHRDEFGRLLAAASGVICPSEKTRAIIRSFHSGPGIRFRVVPHGMDRCGPVRHAPRSSTAPLRVGVVGSVCQPWKGAANYLELVALTRGHPLEWHFFGDLSAYDYRARLETTSPAVVVHGAYDRANLSVLLEQHAIDVVAMAPSVHETFSFTLSEVLCAGVPVVSTRMGACEERLEAAGSPDCLADGVSQAAELLIGLARDRDRVAELRRRLRQFRHDTTAQMAERTRAVYGDAASLPHCPRPLVLESSRRNYEAYCAAVQWADADRAAVVTIDPSHGPMWYRLARRMENIVPAVIQRPVRSYFTRKHWSVLVNFSARDFAGAERKDLRRLRHAFGRAVFSATGPEPSLTLRTPDIDAAAVAFLRLRVRCRIPRTACACISRAKGERDEFSEQDSIAIAFEGTSGWQDILIDLRGSPVRERWLSETKLGRLRLELPISQGSFELDSLVLARPIL